MPVPKKIVVGFDGSDQARDALALARLLAEEFDSSILIVCVFKHEMPLVVGWEDYERGVAAVAEEMLGGAVEALGSKVKVETRAQPSTSDAAGLIQVAESEQADLIVVGSSHRGAVGRTFIGSVGDRILHGAPCPVAIAPKDYAKQTAKLRVVVAGFDGSEQARSALAMAVDTALAAEATLRVVGAAQPNSIFGGYAVAAAGYDSRVLEREVREQLEREIGEEVDRMPASIRPEGKVSAGDPAKVLVDECERGADLLIVGSRGYGPVRVVLLGSVSAKLVREAPCPVMVIPRGSA